jgi:hypothetical protein
MSNRCFFAIVSMFLSRAASFMLMSSGSLSGQWPKRYSICAVYSHSSHEIWHRVIVIPCVQQSIWYRPLILYTQCRVRMMSILSVLYTARFSNRCGWPARGLGLDWKNGSVQFQTWLKTEPALSWRCCYPDHTLTCGLLAGFIILQSSFSHTPNFGSYQGCEFWLYQNMIYT